MRPRHARFVTLALLIAGPAAAEPEQRASVVEPRPETEQRAAPVIQVEEPQPAPLPGDESGRTDPIDTGDSTLRQVGRGLLFFPKVAANVVLTPVRASVWLFDRYQLDKLYKQVFFNDAYTIGLYPTVAFETGFGLNAGARFVHRDLFGEREHLAIQGGYGGQFREVVSGQLKSGDRFGRVGLELDVGYERRPIDAFYGIGNGDSTAATGMLIDPRIDDGSVEVRYRQARGRVAVMDDIRVIDGFHLRSAATLTEVQFGTSVQGTPIDMVYDQAGLVGFGGVRYGYGELELRWDDRHRITTFEPSSVHSAGSLASVFGGLVARTDGGGDFWRYGLDLQHFVRIAAGPRVLALRLHGEGVTGSRDEVPFNELPKLGGLTFLRGYPLDRFRDRIAAFSSAEYQWDLSQLISASLFVDAGRVFPDLHDLGVDHLRVGYGIALEGHTDGSFVLQGSLASSIDGGLFLSVAFNPVFDLDERVRRR